MPKATLINPSGQKVAVESGSQQAQQYFGQGYTLYNPTTTTPLNVDRSILNEPIPVSALKANSPKVADIPKIYRIGSDIYDATTNSKLGYSDFMNNYSGRAIEVQAPVQSAEQPSVQPEQEKPLTASDRISNFYQEYTKGKSEIKEQAIADTKLNEKSDAVTESQIALNDARLKLQNLQVMNEKELISIAEQGRSLTTRSIGGQQAMLSREQKFDVMIAQNEYNNALVATQIAEGAYDRAREIVKETAEDFYQNAQFQLEILKEQNAIDEKMADRLEKEAEYERDLALEGYVYVNDPSKLKGLTENDIFRDPQTGKVYIKPPKKIAQIIEVNGRKIGVDEYGNQIKDYGTADSFSDKERATMILDLVNSTGMSVEDANNYINQITNAPTGGFRTDRHNNPTAMTTDVAKTLGLVEGVDYVKGDAFPNNPNIFTAKLIGNPFSTTIKGLDNAAKSPNMKAFYTQSGQQRWTHTAMSDEQWNKLSYADKIKVVTEMYRKEGGSGNLGQTSSTTQTNKNTTIDGYDISKFTQQFYNTSRGQQVLNNEQQYQTNFLSQQAIKDFLVVQNKAASIDAIIKAGVGGPGDLSLVYEFMKALDPNSVVRESEYASAAKSGNIFAGAYAKFNGYLKEEGGILPENVKQSFLEITNRKLEIGKQTYEQIRNQYRKTAYEQGLNPEHVAPDLITQSNKTQENPNVSNYIDSLNLDNTSNLTNNSNSFYKDGMTKSSSPVGLLGNLFGWLFRK